jgi:hypothetical protein
MRIALFVVRFGKLPEQIDPEEINEFLVGLAHDPKSPSRSSFIDAMIKEKSPPENTLQRLVRLTGINPCLCPVCKTGKMVAIKVIPGISPSPE